METNENILEYALNNLSPVLFIGAGFTIGAKSSNDKPLPTGLELKEMILLDLLGLSIDSDNYSELHNRKLSEVCQFAQNEITIEELTRFLKTIYSGIIPASYHFNFKKYPWKRIYSTNIDDLLENIYNVNEIVIQNDKIKKHIKANCIEIIKLHGCVNKPENGFTFSNNEYIDSMVKSRDYRFNQLGMDIQTEMFIFLGSDFDEVNLSYYFRLYEYAGYQSTKMTFIFINPKPSVFFTSQVKNLGGKIIPWTSEQFSDFLQSNAIKDLKDSTITHLGCRLIREIKNDLDLSAVSSSDLYLGLLPTWIDIMQDWDFRNDKVENTFLNVKKRFDHKNFVFCIFGKALVGKSVLLKRIGLMLFNDGYEVITVIGKHFDSYSFIQYTKVNKSIYKYALLFEDASFSYFHIKKLLKWFPNNKELIVITTSRPYPHTRKRYILNEVNHYEYLLEQQIDRIFAATIINKLEEKGFSGILSNKHDIQQKISYVIQHNDISSLLYSITYGSHFIERFNKIYLDILSRNNIQRSILIKLYIFDKLDLPYIPFSLLNLIYCENLKKDIDEIGDMIKINEKGGIELRNSYFNQLLDRDIKSVDIIDNIKEILTNISPQVDESHSLWNEILASLTKEKLLRKNLSLKTKDIKQMLYDVGGYFNYNYNYWLQLGIAEQADAEFEKALNHFRQAEAISPESYMVQNAIGRNYLKQARHINNLPVAQSYYNEGERILLSLINNMEEFQVKAFSTHCYLYEKIKFCELYGIIPTSREVKAMYRYLSDIIARDPEDTMAKHISNIFFKYLRGIHKSGLIRFELYDLSKMHMLLFTKDNDDVDLDF